VREVWENIVTDVDILVETKLSCTSRTWGPYFVCYTPVLTFSTTQNKTNWAEFILIAHYCEWRELIFMWHMSLYGSVICVCSSTHINFSIIHPLCIHVDLYFISTVSYASKNELALICSSALIVRLCSSHLASFCIFLFLFIYSPGTPCQR